MPQPWGPRDVVVVGAGISGIAAARALSAAEVGVVVLDRGRRPGGRMADRRVFRGTDRERVVDVGASYLVPRDEAFTGVVEGWHGRGLARPWTDTFATLDAGASAGTTSGPVRWAAPGGLRSLVEDLADGVDVRGGRTVTSVRSTEGGALVDHVPAAAAVLAVPDPQAARLLEAGTAAHAAVADREWEPVLAWWGTWAERWWPELDGAFVSGSDVAWLADDGRRRGDGAAVLVAHTTPEYAAAHLDDFDGAGAHLAAETATVLGVEEVPPAGESGVQRWTFARPAAPHDAPYHLGSVSLCGDGWGAKPGVEQAWLSGHRLGTALGRRLAGTPAR